MIFHNIPQNTPEWFALRAGKPTGSKASSLITPTGKAVKSVEPYAIMLANEIVIGQSSSVEGWGGNDHTNRGHNQEDPAAKRYSAIYNVELMEVGFCTDDEQRYGVSPDRVVVDNNGLVEIKNLDDQAHTAAIVHYNRTRKPMPDRMAQCQMQLYVSGYDYVDLFYNHKLLPPLCIRILPIKSYFEMLELQIDEVINERDRIVKLLMAA